MAIFVVSTLRRRTPWWSYPANIFPVFLGNLCGSLLVAGLFAKVSKRHPFLESARARLTFSICSRLGSLTPNRIGRMSSPLPWQKYTLIGLRSLSRALLAISWVVTARGRQRRADVLILQLVCVAVFQATAARDLISKVRASVWRQRTALKLTPTAHRSSPLSCPFSSSSASAMTTLVRCNIPYNSEWTRANICVLQWQICCTFGAS